MKALLRHTDRFQHCKFSAAQADIRGDRIEYIRRGNQGDQHNEAVGKNLDNRYDITVCLGKSGNVCKLSGAESVLGQHCCQLFKACGMIVRCEKEACLPEAVQPFLRDNAFHHTVRVDHAQLHRRASADEERSLFNGFLGSQGVPDERLLIRKLYDVLFILPRLIYDKLVVVFVEFVSLPEVSVNLTIQKTFDLTTVTLQCIQRDILFKCPVKFNIFVNCNAQRVFFVIVVRFAEPVFFQQSVKFGIIHEVQISRYSHGIRAGFILCGAKIGETVDIGIRHIFAGDVAL